MATWIEALKACVAEGDVAGVRERIAAGECCQAADFEHVLHHAFQIQPGSMAVPPNPEMIRVLTASRLIAPIFAAVYNQDTAAIAELARQDATVLEARDASTFTPLLRAAETCKPEVVNCLLGLGADIHATRDNGFGCLHSWRGVRCTPKNASRRLSCWLPPAARSMRCRIKTRRH